MKPKRAGRGKSAPYRVGLDLHTLSGLYQGSRSHCVEIFSRVVRLLPEFQFILFFEAATFPSGYMALFTAPNTEFVDMPHRPAPVRLLWQLPQLVMKHRVDLLHTQYIAPPLCSAATAVTIHDLLFESHPQYFSRFFRLRSRILFRSSARRAKLCFTVSDFAKKQLVQLYSIPESKVDRIHNAADNARFFPGDAGAGTLSAYGLEAGRYFLSVGRLEPRKNYAHLIEAFALVRDTKFPLVIVGQKDFSFEEIFRAVERTELEGRIKILENVDDDILPILYRHARAFLYPSYAEGFGMPVIEAMASGTPVLSSNTTALPEVAGAAAILIDPSSVSEIAAGIQRLAFDDFLFSALREAGLEQSGKFQWSESAERVAQRYREFFTAR